MTGNSVRLLDHGLGGGGCRWKGGKVFERRCYRMDAEIVRPRVYAPKSLVKVKVTVTETGGMARKRHQDGSTK
jgi:hypothetical protein